MIIYVFDLVYHRGRFLGDLPLVERKAMLREIPWKEPFRVVGGTPLRELRKELRRALVGGFEGVVIKKKNSKYRVGDRCPEATEYWRKIKGLD